MKRNFKKTALTSVLTLSLVTGSLMIPASGALAAMNGGSGMGMMNGMQNTAVALADTASEIVSGTTTNSAADLAADTENAAVITVTEENSQVTISESGTYIVSGSASDGNITVKKGTTGVVLILEDLNLTSTTGATVSVNKDSEVQIVVSGSVSLTDAENPADETSEDTETADAYDGAAIKVKSGSSVYLTGDGALTVNGSAKNGIKTGDGATLIIDGEDLTVDITAANDGINASYDLTILSGAVTISAADDALHADRVLTVGSEDSTASPIVTVKSSTEGLEGTVVNIHSGTVTVNSTDDAINAANSDGTYEGELAYSINVTGGNVTVSSKFDGLDSNGNVNLTGGTVTIASSARNGGDAGIDYDGSMYVSSDATLNNNNGVAGPDMMRGQMGQMGQTANGQQMTAPGFRQNGEDRQNGQQGTTSGVDGVSGATSDDRQQMTVPDFSQNGQIDQDGQNSQPNIDGQHMARPDIGQNGMNGQMAQPEFGQNGRMGFPGQNGPMQQQQMILLWKRCLGEIKRNEQFLL